MPNALFDADSRFPDLAAPGLTTERRLAAVQDYLYLLLEALRWTLRNLSAENFTEASLRELSENLDVRSVVTDTLITNELYARFGAIADLTVDELRTDYRKAARYLAGDTSPLDYLHIYDECIDFRTATVRVTDGVAETEPLVRGGRRFYWTDGAKTQMTCEEATDWPVTVYRYDELRKGSFRFEDYSPPGGTLTKVPTFILGAGVGDPDDPDAGRGFIRKGVDSFDLWLHGADGDNGLFIGEYTDLVGVRKTAAMDFSGWDAGSFTETLDGNVTASYAVAFDAQGRPARITDGAGHATEVTW